MLTCQLSGTVGKGGWGDTVRRGCHQLSCQFHPSADGMHRFKSAAETVRHGAEQLKPLGMNAGEVARMRVAASSSRFSSADQPAFEIWIDAPLGFHVSASKTAIFAFLRQGALESASAVAKPHGPPPTMATSTARAVSVGATVTTIANMPQSSRIGAGRRIELQRSCEVVSREDDEIGGQVANLGVELHRLSAKASAAAC